MKRWNVDWKSWMEKLSNSPKEITQSIRVPQGLREKLQSRVSLSDPVEIKKEHLQNIAILLCAWFLADLIGLAIEQKIPVPEPSPLKNRIFSSAQFANPAEFDVIAARNLFQAKEPKLNEFNLEADPVPTTLPFALVGTVVLNNPLRSVAAIQDKTENKLHPVRVGDEITGKAEILEVHARKVIFVNLANRRKEYVELPEEPEIKITGLEPRVQAPTKNIQKVDDQKFAVTREEINSQMANMNTLLTQARAIPVPEGFQLMDIQPGSFYEKIGLKRNDIITCVNGEKITDVAKAFQLLQELKTMNSLDLCIKRGGKDSVFNYDIR